MVRLNYVKRLDGLLDNIFAKSDDLGMELIDLAEAAGLGRRTVSRINYRLTRLPRLKTIMMLAAAVGMNVEITRGVAKINGRNRRTA